MKSTNDPAVFWASYEKEHGEKVLAHSLGRYSSGWMDWEYTLWGLLIATDAGFRFHHFPHEGWIQMLSRASSGSGEPPTEKTIFLPSSEIKSIELKSEKSLWKRILFARPPILVIEYSLNGAASGRMLFETDSSAAAVVAAIEPRLSKG